MSSSASDRCARSRWMATAETRAVESDARAPAGLEGDERPCRARSARGRGVAAWKRAAEPEPGPRRRATSRTIVVPSSSTGPRRRHEPADGVHQRRLAGTVGADQADDLAVGHVDATRGPPPCCRRSARRRRGPAAPAPRPSSGARSSGRPASARRAAAWRGPGRGGSRATSRRARRRAVADLDEPAGEVERRTSSPMLRGEQRDEVVVGEERRQADDPDRAEDGAGHRAQPADHDHGHDQQRVVDAEVRGRSAPPGCWRRAGTRRRRRGRRPGRRPASFVRGGRHRVRGRRVRVVAHPDRGPADAARPQAGDDDDGDGEHGEGDVVEGPLGRDVDAEDVGTGQRHGVA